MRNYNNITPILDLLDDCSPNGSDALDYRIRWRLLSPLDVAEQRLEGGAVACPFHRGHEESPVVPDVAYSWHDDDVRFRR